MKAVQKQINDFLTELSDEHRLSTNTLDAYRSDLGQYSSFLKEKEGCSSWSEVSELADVNYLYWLRDMGNSSTTIARKAASVRGFHRFLLRNHLAETDPTIAMQVPKSENKPRAVLSIEEMNTLLSHSDQKTDIGIRDRAMLELLYATGMRVSELIHLNVQDLDLTLGFVRCGGTSRNERIIPIGEPARQALEVYIAEVRNKVKTGQDHQTLFLNRQKKELTRQGVWKILKQSAERAGIRPSFSPEMIRQSLAAHLIERGADFESVDELMGRENTYVTRRFPNRPKHQLKEVYSRCHPRAAL